MITASFRAAPNSKLTNLAFTNRRWKLANNQNSDAANKQHLDR